MQKSNINDVFNFLINSGNDPDFSRWAYQYLRLRAGATKRFAAEPDHLAIKGCLDSLEENSRKLVLIKMRGAFRQKKYRDSQIQKDRKPSSFILSNRALTKLRKLAREADLSIKETLEQIVEQTYLDNKREKERIREAKKAQKPPTPRPYKL